MQRRGKPANDRGCKKSESQLSAQPGKDHLKRSGDHPHQKQEPSDCGVDDERQFVPSRMALLNLCRVHKGKWSDGGTGVLEYARVRSNECYRCSS